MLTRPELHGTVGAVASTHWLASSAGMAVLTWQYGYSVASAEVRAFAAAGFTTDQYELMVMSIAAGRRDAQEKRFQR